MLQAMQHWAGIHKDSGSRPGSDVARLMDFSAFVSYACLV